MKKLLALPIAAVVALAAVTAYAAWDRGGGSESAPSGATTSSAMPSEGIDVHGDWKIAIYNEDGSLDQQYAFSNDPASSAPAALAQIFARTRSIGTWEIILGNAGGTLPCGNECNIAETSGPGIESENLVVEVVPGQPTFLRLSGSVVAAEGGEITTVGTSLFVCPGTSAPGCQAVSESRAMTGTDLAEPASVTSGQTIQVQVEITFAAPAP
jgi:hypothetical protein